MHHQGRDWRGKEYQEGGAEVALGLPESAEASGETVNIEFIESCLVVLEN
jgi:hypothetical protein